MSGIAVFVGPSLSAERVTAALPGARVESPACRGDLGRVLSDGARTILLIDGAFAHTPAVSPGEVVHALDAGARVIGAASLGAIRAAECRPAGMEGIGAVQLLYRLGVIRDDDEVAVAVEPDRGHRAASVALITIRFAVLSALRARQLDRPAAQAVLSAAKRMHFSLRHWEAVFAEAEVVLSDRLRDICRTSDIKRRDAEMAVACLAAEVEAAGVGAAAPGVPAARRPTVPTVPGLRYHGHDPLLGLSPRDARRTLADWLLASGRYRRYSESPPGAATEDALWDRLEEERELEHELMRAYAASRVSR